MSCFSPLHRPLSRLVGMTVVVGFVLGALVNRTGGQQAPPGESGTKYAKEIQPLLTKYCIGCHSTKDKKGSLDLERFGSPNDIRKEVKVWQGVVEQLEAGEMPPKDKLQPSAEERKTLQVWVKTFLDIEARANAGDPGHVPLRRLSNAEYNYTIRDLTGIDLQPAREFPADGAAGEGFTNAAEALTDISPTLLNKYLNAAKSIADHAVFLPDGIRFSPSKTRRDWSDEGIAKLRKFYSVYATGEGRLQVQPYLLASIKHRDVLQAGQAKPEDIATKEKLNPKYFAILWQTLTDKTSTQPLDAIRTRWQTSTEKDVPALMKDISDWQSKLWKTVRIGSYMRPEGKGFAESTTRQLATNPNPVTPQVHAGYDAFRSVFPLYLCFPVVVPTDEVVSLKMFHREDEPLIRLFLNAEQTHVLELLWAEHQFISRQAMAENDYLPQFIGFVTQDQPKEMLAHIEAQRPVFQKRADAFLGWETAAQLKQLEALLDFATRAFRRPLQAKEKADFLALYQTIRGKGVTHNEAYRGVLARVLVSPAFLFRVEHVAPAQAPAPVSDFELASRLSYFLWSSMPDDELRRLAATGQLRDPSTLTAQVQRMLKSDKTRALATEFGTQWIHVRGFDEFNEKNEKLFPTFDALLRKAMYEESVLFFQDMFQSNRPVTAILDADYAFVNETLAKHYGIPNVKGPQFQRVDGVRKFGRGGVLGLASVQTKQVGASRTSPVLRGNWVVETLLGEKLPRPPANVPRLPDAEGTDSLTMRQLVEKHTKDPACAHCHVRIDPYGFALEKYDPIGRLREKELGGLAVDVHTKLKDGTEFEGIEGLRNFLLTKKKDVIVRLFCQRLLGYALGRAVTLSDTSLLDDMVTELRKHNGQVTAAVQAIVRSPQFRMVRGSEPLK